MQITFTSKEQLLQWIKKSRSEKRFLVILSFRKNTKIQLKGSFQV